MLLIKNGRVIDPTRGIDGQLDILITQGKIARIGAGIDPAGEGHAAASCSGDQDLRVIDARGKVVSPGFIDIHTHLREPGHEYKETIASGCAAAAAGGFTAVACMPNTDPINDNPSVTEYILRKAQSGCGVRVHPIGAITQGSKGEVLAEIGALKSAGVVAVSDDGQPVMKAEVMRRALEYAKTFGLPVISHCEDKTLSQDGAMHEGYMSTRLGLPAIPAAAEEIMVARDILLCEMTSSRLHIAHVSTAGSVALIRQAKAKGLPVTGEVTPHHFCLTDEEVASFDTNTKVNPPLRSREHREALLEGLRDGTLEVIATDHAPHSRVEKEVEYAFAANGMVGLETAVALTLTCLVQTGILALSQAIAKLSANPARILGLPVGIIEEGYEADLTILDPEREFVVDPETFRSKSRNTPFGGRKLQGRAIMTIVGGNVVWEVEADDR